MYIYIYITVTAILMLVSLRLLTSPDSAAASTSIIYLFTFLRNFRHMHVEFGVFAVNHPTTAPILNLGGEDHSGGPELQKMSQKKQKKTCSMFQCSSPQPPQEPSP